MKYWVTIGATTPLEWLDWLLGIVGAYDVDWKFNDDSCGHYFLCFEREVDAIAFRLRFGL